jgi:Zn-dependent M28 family amino/carboxypeptidase
MRKIMNSINNNLFKVFIGCIVLALFSLNGLAQEKTSILSTEEDIAESVKLAPCKSKERLDAVKKLFAEMGAKEEEIIVEKFNKDKIQNVVVKKKGKSDEIVVVGAHYDKTDDGCGAIDNWTGISVIAHLYKTISKMETQKTYVFVAFDQEEKGLLGSAAMVKAIDKEQRSQYCAMVNIDSLGFTLPFSLQQSSTHKMVLLATNVAEENKMKFNDISIPGADADSTSFKNQKIPAITLSGLDNKWQTYLHTSNDKLEKINMQSVFIGYRFTLAFLSKIDVAICKDLNK